MKRIIFIALLLITTISCAQYKKPTIIVADSITSTIINGRFIGDWNGLDRLDVSVQNLKRKNYYQIRSFGTDYTITNLDGFIMGGSVTATSVTIPLNIDPRNMILFNTNTGVLTLSGASGVTTVPTSITLNQYESADIIYVSPDYWCLVKR